MKFKPLYFLLFITLCELALMGSGQMLKIGPLTLRMMLYLLIVSISIISIITINRVEKYFAKLVWFFTITMFIGLLLAAINLNPPDLIFEDLKPLIYFYSILFYSLMIKDETTILMVNRIMKNSAILLAVCYLLMVIGLYTGFINFGTFYGVLNQTGEVFFKGKTGFFYKGFLYLCVGVFFFLDRFSFKNGLLIFLLLTAIILTFTRGFLLSLVIVLIIYLLLFYRYKIMAFVILGAGAFFTFTFLSFYTDALGDKSGSDNMRYLQIAEVKEATDPFSFFIGHGFGRGTYSRPIHMEISYLEIFHKQGIFGLLFWIALLFCLFLSYYNAQKNGNKKFALPYLLASIFVYLQSFTNPFLNNPIGMSIVLISIVVLKRLETIKMGITT